ncbi:MAG: VCBS repeat-containing protein, partial [Planctomycetes bacterium]|nr:VCBS repeat-containing protein [Planctomycetota bacterium]
QSLIAALAKDDRDRMVGFFREGFQGSVIDGPATERHKGPISEIRRRAKTTTAPAANVSQVIDALRKPIPKMKKIDRSKLRVLEIERVDEASARWKAHLLISFAGLDEKSLPFYWESEHWIECTIEDEKTLNYAAFVDRWDIVSETEWHAEKWLMEEVTDDWGLNQVSIPDNWNLPNEQVEQYRFQVAVADFDRDGDLDVIVAISSGPDDQSQYARVPHLLESDQGRFHDVAFDTHWNGADFLCCSFDYNNDGWPDLMIGRRLYRNNSGKFVDVTAASGIKVEPECMGAVVADYDCDGLLDLYLLYQVESGSTEASQQLKWVDDDSGGENRLWRNLGDGRFEDVTKRASAGGGHRHTHAAAWFFYDDDHYPDLYLANDFGKNVILRNKGDGSFEDISHKTPASDFATSMGVAIGDLDNNGRSDIYVANMYSKMGRRIIGQVCDADYPAGIFSQIKGSCAGNRLYLAGDDNGYRDVSTKVGVNSVGWAYAPATVDLDNDGWLDLYATTGFQSFDRKKPDG